MIIDAFKNKIFPKAPTALEDDEEPPKDEDKEEKKDDRLPTIEEEEEPMELKEQIAELDKRNDRDLIYNYFFKNSLTEIVDKLKNHRNNPTAFQSYNNFMVRLAIGLKRLENDINNMSKNEVKK